MTTVIRRAAVVWALLALGLVYVAREVDRVHLEPSIARA